MTQVKDIIQVEISKATQAVSQAGFGTALILGPRGASVFTAGQKVRTYSSVAAMVTDGFLITDPEYLIASALMSQTKKPLSFLVGVHTTPSSEVTVLVYTGVLSAGSVTVTLNGTVYTEAYAVSQQATMDALAVKIAADTLITSAVWDNATLTLTITGVAGQAISYGGATGADFTTVARTIVPAGTTTIAADLTAITEQMSGWYALLMVSTSRDDILAAAAAIELQERIYGFDVHDVDALDSISTLSLPKVLSGLNYEQTGYIYSEDRAKYYMASWFGKILPEAAGSVNWAYKTLTGVATYSLTDTEIAALTVNKCNTYQAVGGIDVTLFGTVAKAGLYFDIIRGEHWLIARIQEAVYGLLANTPKIPYTEKGFVQIQNAVYNVLRAGVAQGFLADDGELSVTIPRLADISTANKASRYLPDVTFTGSLQGAINTVKISGTLTFA